MLHTSVTLPAPLCAARETRHKKSWPAEGFIEKEFCMLMEGLSTKPSSWFFERAARGQG